MKKTKLLQFTILDKRKGGEERMTAICRAKSDMLFFAFSLTKPASCAEK
jgi:hypothetical protein